MLELIGGDSGPDYGIDSALFTKGTVAEQGACISRWPCGRVEADGKGPINTALLMSNALDYRPVLIQMGVTKKHKGTFLETRLTARGLALAKSDNT